MFRLDIQGYVARIALDRPEARNAIATGHWSGLTAAVDRAVSAGARVLILESRKPAHFCAGADLRELETLPGNPDAQRAMRTEMRHALDHLAAAPLPVLASIRGGCFGAGVALALACDIRIARAEARFAIPPARIGITYPHEDIARLVALVGPGQARRLLYAGQTIDAAEAARIGLVELIDADPDTVAEQIAAGAPSSHRLLKRSIAAAEPHIPELDAAFEAAFDGPDFAEGIAAMRQRRRAEFGA